MAIGRAAHASSSVSRSSRFFLAREGRYSNTSSWAAAGVKTCSTLSWRSTSAARPPMTAERRTLASATSRTALLARHLEVFEHVGLRDPASLQLPGDVAAQHVVQFALELDRKGDRRSREEDPGQTPASRHEDWRSGT